MMPIYTTRLTNTVGRSFKEYNISLKAEESGVIVHYSHGRIGSSLVTGRKNESPIPLNEAMKIAERLIASKIKKGYVVETTSDNTKIYRTNRLARSHLCKKATDNTTALPNENA